MTEAGAGQTAPSEASGGSGTDGTPAEREVKPEQADPAPYDAGVVKSEPSSAATRIPQGELGNWSQTGPAPSSGCARTQPVPSRAAAHVCDASAKASPPPEKRAS